MARGPSSIGPTYATSLELIPSILTLAPEVVLLAKYVALVLSRTSPAISTLYKGDTTPTPRFPFASTVRISDDVPTLKSRELPVAVDDAIERSDVGVVVPMPTLLFVLST